MGLIAWYKLDGDANDYSGLANNGILRGSPSYITGKIGQAILLDGATQYVEVPNQEYLKLKEQYFSVFMWVNMSSDDSDGKIISKPWNGSGQYNYGISNGVDSLTLDILGSSGYSLSTPASSFEKNKWVHIGFTIDKTLVRFYINGSKVAEGNHSITNWVPPTGDANLPLAIGTLYPYGTFNQPTHAVKGSIDDVRIYDHALSALEVKELSKAKILHYTFDTPQESTTNKFLQFTEDGLSPIAGDGSPIHLGLDSNNTFRGLRSVKFQTGNSGNFYINDSARIATDVTSTQWTASIYIKRVDGASITSVGTYMYVTNNTNNNTNVNVEPVENGWYKVTRTRTGLTAGYPTLFGCYNLDIGVQYYIAMWQIEAKDHDTEYVKGSRTAKVYDTSGFGNNSVDLTEADTPRWVSTSRIGSGAYAFNYTNEDFIALPYFTHDPQAVTLSAWIYSNDITKAQNIISRNGPYFMRITSSTLRIGFYTGTWFFVNGSITLQSNTWYHLVVTYDGAYARGYVNGVKDIEGAKTGNVSASWGSTRLGYTTGGADAPMDGKIDDVRIYATALSDADVKDLYETGAEVTKSGQLFARDFSGSASNTDLEITKTGTASYKEFSTIGIVDDNMVAYIPLDGDAYDYSESYLTTSTVTDVVYLSGKIGKGANLNGTTSKVYINDNGALNFTGSQQYTAMAFIYPRLGGTTWHGIFSKGNAQQWALTLNSPSGYLHYESNQGGIVAISTAPGTIVSNTWYHVAIRFNGTNKQIFINGVSVATQVASTLNSASNSEVLRIGEGNTGELFNGIIENVKAFNRALTDIEIMQEYSVLMLNETQVTKTGVFLAKSLIQY